MKKLSLFDKSFFKLMLPLAVPIVLQNLLMASFRLVDTLMIGQLGDTAIAAVGLAGNVSFFAELVTFGIASGMAVFMAQFYGAGDENGIHRAFGASFVTLIPFGLLAALCVGLMPKSFMVLMTDSPELIGEGARYLSTAAYSYLGMIFTQLLCTTLRSTERVKLPMIATAASAMCNALLNYLLIFGKLGLPQMGVLGAGLATTISAFISPAILLIASAAQRNIAIRSFRGIFKIRGFYPRFWRRALPALANEMLWSLSIVAINMVFGRLGQQSNAALTIFRTVENIAFVFFVGVCNACNILTGKHIGAGDIDGGKRIARQFVYLTPLMGIVLGTAIVLLRGPILSLFDASADTLYMAQVLLIIFSVDIIVRNIPYLAVVGIFRAGGDTKMGLIGDVAVNWGVLVPVVAVCALVLKIPFLWTYLIMVVLDDICKCCIYVPYFLSNRWIRPIDD